MPHWILQLVRYGVVGCLSNGLMYLVYLLLTHQEVGPKLAMSLVYFLGVLGSFLFNRRWTFEHGGNRLSALAQYFAAYAIGYAINLTAIAVWVDRLEFPHHWVQALTVVLLAIFLFLLQRFWVFRNPPARSVCAALK